MAGPITWKNVSAPSADAAAFTRIGNRLLEQGLNNAVSGVNNLGEANRNLQLDDIYRQGLSTLAQGGDLNSGLNALQGSNSPLRIGVNEMSDLQSRLRGMYEQASTLSPEQQNEINTLNATMQSQLEGVRRSNDAKLQADFNSFLRDENWEEFSQTQQGEGFDIKHIVERIGESEFFNADNGKAGKELLNSLQNYVSNEGKDIPGHIINLALRSVPITDDGWIMDNKEFNTDNFHNFVQEYQRRYNNWSDQKTRYDASKREKEDQVRQLEKGLANKLLQANQNAQNTARMNALYQYR